MPQSGTAVLDEISVHSNQHSFPSRSMQQKRPFEMKFFIHSIQHSFPYKSMRN